VSTFVDPKIKIFFVNGWGENAHDLLARYKKQTPGELGIWKEIVAVQNKEDADYYIALGYCNVNELDANKIIFVQREPKLIDNRVIAHSKAKILWEDQHCGITWWLNKTYDELKAMTPSNRKEISCIVSSKHPHRNKFISRLCENNDSGLDLFGRGHNKQLLGDCYKGPINNSGNCKLDGLLPYKSTIVLENSQQKNYWTEKLADAYLSWCLPLYYGAPNIDAFFDKESFRILDINDAKPQVSINNILVDLEESVVMEHIKQAREDILDKYNIWEIIRKKIEEVRKNA
jgi:hypothetical protein